MTVMAAPALSLSSSATSRRRLSFRATSTRSKPSRANSFASSYPIPLVAPVTRAVFLSTLPPIIHVSSQYTTRCRCRHSRGVKHSFAFPGDHDAVRLICGNGLSRRAAPDPPYPGQAYPHGLEGSHHTAEDTDFR